MATNAPPEDRWHLDKKVPIGIIFTILLQGAGGLWFVSKLDARVLALESTQHMQRERDDRQDKASAEALAQLQRQLERIDEKLDRLIEKGSRK
jgi:Tfp pilus assembly protein PilO